MPILKTGDRAYLDGHGPIGMVKIVIEGITGPSGIPNSAQSVRYRVADRRNRFYHFGERLETSGLHVFPRSCLYYRGGIAHIRPFRIETDTPAARMPGFVLIHR